MKGIYALIKDASGATGPIHHVETRTQTREPSAQPNLTSTQLFDFLTPLLCKK